MFHSPLAHNAHTHTRTHTHTRAHTHIHTTLWIAVTKIRLKLMQSCSQRWHTQTHPRTHTLKQTHTRTCTHTRARTHTHTHTRTHSCRWQPQKTRLKLTQLTLLPNNNNCHSRGLSSPRTRRSKAGLCTAPVKNMLSHSLLG